MKEDLKTILYMGLGAISETNEKMKEISDSLYEKGKELYEKGVIANEELKHNINEALNNKNNNRKQKAKEDIINVLNNLSEQEKEEIKNKMGWTDVNNEKGASNK